ncbi:chitin synthase-domain-containing protein [Amylocystis lapponica]|nr:chitin synthase-domain-containing protein [Amylocystis lapponica]
MLLNSRSAGKAHAAVVEPTTPYVCSVLIAESRSVSIQRSATWLFNAIGRMLDPSVCVLIDVGTKPTDMSIYHLWEAFHDDPNLGGCCGEVRAIIGKRGVNVFMNPLVAAQNFEYKMSNILVKPFESSFGHVSVLPGAFSAYRYQAIRGRPLKQYFRGDHTLRSNSTDNMSIFRKNMFLAEDRILCFELVANAGAHWTLTYVRSSTAETDVPDTAAEFIGQRRRWLNGSFAASVYSLANFRQFYESKHSKTRKGFFLIQASYNLFLLIYTWFALANMWLAFDIIIYILPSEGLVLFGTVDITHWVNEVLHWIYLVLLALQFVLALGNRPKGERWTYVATLGGFAVLAIYLLVCSLALTVKAFLAIPDDLKNKTASQIAEAFFTPPIGSLIAAMLCTGGIYLISSCLYCDAWHMITSFLPYLCLAPSYINVLNVYAFCSLHDVSWRTKGSDKVDGLPSVTPQAENSAVVTDVERNTEDRDSRFSDACVRLGEEPVGP